MIQPAEREGALAFRELHPQLLGGAAANDRQGLAGAGAAAAEHFAGVGVGGEAALIDAIAVVLGHQLLGLVVDADQEITAGIEGDEALRKLVIDLLALGLLALGGGRRRLLRSRLGC